MAGGDLGEAVGDAVIQAGLDTVEIRRFRFS